MDPWVKIKWTQAGQIAELMGVDTGLENPGESPESGYESLRREGKLELAVRYLAQSLPRFEAVAWAARQVDTQSRAARLAGSERQALDCAIRWVEEPVDEYRRAAFAAGMKAPDGSPARFLAYAVFMSGGSISDTDLPPVQPAIQVCGQLAATAIVVGAYRSAQPTQVLASACGAGERIAAHGFGILERQ